MSKVKLYRGGETSISRRTKKALKRSYLESIGNFSRKGRNKWKMSELRIREVSTTRGDRKMKPVRGLRISSMSLG